MEAISAVKRVPELHQTLVGIATRCEATAQAAAAACPS